jgi:putative spermidine/putrescine transport system substrate-binding protein
MRSKTSGSRRSVSLHRRRILKGAAALGAAAALPSWAQQPPAVAKGTTFTLSTWGAVTQDMIKKHVQAEFEKSTGATLAYDIGGQGQRYNKLVAQRNNPPADAFFSTDDQVIAGIRAGVLEPVARATVPRTSELYDWAILGKGEVPENTFAGLAWGIIAHVIGYNPERVKQKPTSWADLWRPEFRGKLAFCQPFHSQMPAFVITAAEMAGGSAQSPDAGFKKLAELRPGKLVITWTDWAAMLKAGDLTVGTEFDYYLEDMKRQKYPIEWVVPKEKGFATLQCVSAVKNGKNPQLVAHFMNLLADSKAQHAFSTEDFQGTANKMVKLTPQQVQQCTCGAQLSQLRFFDPSFIANVRPKWIERMNTEVVPAWGKR